MKIIHIFNKPNNVSNNLTFLKHKIMTTLSKAALIEVAKQKGIEVTPHLSKEEVIALLNQEKTINVPEIDQTPFAGEN